MATEIPTRDASSAEAIQALAAEVAELRQHVIKLQVKVIELEAQLADQLEEFEELTQTVEGIELEMQS